MRILIADSSLEVLAALRLVLEQHGHVEAIGEARDALSLFSQVARTCPDIVLLDAGLAGLQRPARPPKARAGHPGLPPLAELVETLHLLCPALRVVALSSSPTIEKESLLAGADAFICKSDPPDRLLALLNGVSQK